MNKVLNPKFLAITTIVAIIVNCFLSILSYNLNSINVSNFVTMSLTRPLTSSGIYIVIYLLIVLYKKDKNMKTLNLILLICIIISSLASIVGQVINIDRLSTISSSIIGNVTDRALINLIETIIFLILETIMLYGIINKKQFNYKAIAIIAITVVFSRLIFFVIYNITLGFSLINGLISLLILLVEIISSCSFILFLYLYGKSINERSLENER